MLLYYNIIAKNCSYAVVILFCDLPVSLEGGLEVISWNLGFLLAHITLAVLSAWLKNLDPGDENIITVAQLQNDTTLY